MLALRRWKGEKKVEGGVVKICGRTQTFWGRGRGNGCIQRQLRRQRFQLSFYNTCEVNICRPADSVKLIQTCAACEAPLRLFGDLLECRIL